jgi:adenylate cyclase, class 2
VGTPAVARGRQHVSSDGRQTTSGSRGPLRGGRNVEIKARLGDRARVRAALVALGGRDDGVETQHDRFFAAATGRLKLRVSSRDGAALLAYRRADAAELRASEYDRVPVADPEALARVLSAALAPAGEVRKRRHLWFVDNVRVHLDEVEGLGTFLELEAVVDASHSEAQCDARARELLQLFGVRVEDVVAVAYVDLLGGGEGGASGGAASDAVDGAADTAPR